MDVRANARRFLVSFGLLVGQLAGCSVGEVPGGNTVMTPDAPMNNNNNNAAGEASFNSMIKPLVDAKTCARAGCHAGTQPPNLTSFTALEARYKMKPGSSNVLVTKTDHAGIIYFDATQKMTIQSWIDGL